MNYAILHLLRGSVEDLCCDCYSLLAGQRGTGTRHSNVRVTRCHTFCGTAQPTKFIPCLHVPHMDLTSHILIAYSFQKLNHCRLLPLFPKIWP